MDVKHWKIVNDKIMEIPPIKDLCKTLEVKFTQQEERIKALEEENKKLKDNAWVNEECARLKEMYEKMRKENLRGFPITEEEYNKIKDWKENHTCNYRGLKIGSSYTYEFSPTAVGTFGHIKCSCGKEFTFQEP